MDLQSIADNIKVYRKERKFIQSDLAEKAGVSLSTVKKMESGTYPAETKAMLAIAQALEISLADLLRPMEMPQQVYFRCQKVMKEPKVLLHKVYQWVKNCHYLESILDSRIPFALKKIPYKGNPEETAMLARKQLGIQPDEPILDICGLLASAGIKLRFFNRSECFFGLSLRVDGESPAIVVNTHSDITTERQIFSAAHELGHQLMHFKEFKPFDKLDKIQDEQEREANEFASYFLMPREAFIKKWQEADGYSTYEKILFIKSYFRVSYQTVIKRLSNSDKDKEKNLYLYFQKVYKEHHDGCSLSRKVEPFPVNSYTFVEKRFRKLVFEAIRNEKISTRQGSQMLEIPLMEVLDFLNNPMEEP